MEDYTQTHSLYLIPGMTATLRILFESNNNKGLAPAGSKYAGKDLINGFYVMNEDVGEIKAIENDVAVKYYHYKAQPNDIVFVGGDGSIKVGFQVIAVPIHDHSSIVQGGPAYGTYFSDGEED